MKIVNLKEFLKLPVNTVFTKYEPCVIQFIQIKDKSISDFDFCYSEIFGSFHHSNNSDDSEEILIKAEKEGNSFELDLDTISRDSCFNEDQLFVVWEEKDVIALINRLKECVNHET